MVQGLWKWCFFYQGFVWDDFTTLYSFCSKIEQWKVVILERNHSPSGIERIPLSENMNLCMLKRGALGRGGFLFDSFVFTFTFFLSSLPLSFFLDFGVTSCQLLSLPFFIFFAFFFTLFPSFVFSTFHFLSSVFLR